MTIRILHRNSLEYMDEDENDMCYDLVFADVPYPGMKIHDGSSVKLSDDQWFKTYKDLPKLVDQVLVPSGVFAMLLNSKQSCRFQYDVVQFVEKTSSLRLIDQLIWLKPSVIPSKRGKGTHKFRQMFDPVLIFTNDVCNFTFNAEQMSNEDCKRMNGTSSLHVNVVRASSGHDPAYVAATEKVGYDHKGRCPQTLVEYLVTLYTHPGDWVYDPFMGSGTTAAACKKLDRHCIGTDINPQNVALAKAYIANIKS